jgi:hypothetical protein
LANLDRHIGIEFRSYHFGQNTEKADHASTAPVSTSFIVWDALEDTEPL